VPRKPLQQSFWGFLVSELSDISVAYIFTFGALLVCAVAVLVAQVFTIAKWNLAPLLFGLSAACAVSGAMFASHEMSMAIWEAINAESGLTRYVSIADGAAVSFTLLFIGSVTALCVSLVGGVLAYAREWVYREMVQPWNI